jgi:hypothetical protein
VRYHFARGSKPVSLDPLDGRKLSRAAWCVIICAGIVTVAVVVGPTILERIGGYHEALTQKEGDRLYAPVKAYEDEVVLFRREARSTRPDPSLVPRAHKLLAMVFPRVTVAGRPLMLDWGTSAEAKHYANVYLGRIALRQGNVVGARKYLLIAGDNHGSPALSDYGPDMTLADELLERGEREVVLHYFQECQHFWRNGQKNHLEQWTKEVKAGKHPNFGPRSGLSPKATARTAPSNSRLQPT